MEHINAQMYNKDTFFLFNELHQKINNPLLYSMVQNDVIFETDDKGATRFYTKPGIQAGIHCRLTKVYTCEGKNYRVELPPNIPVITQTILTDACGKYLFLRNEHFENIYNPKLSEMIYKDLELGINQRGEPWLYTKQGTQVKEFLKKGMEFINIPVYSVPVKEYTFEGRTLRVELPPMKEMKNTDILDLFS